MSVNFEYRSSILEASDPATDTEWCWFKGCEELTKSVDGCQVGTLSVPAGATVNEVKAIIRLDAKSKR